MSVPRRVLPTPECEDRGQHDECPGERPDAHLGYLILVCPCECHEAGQPLQPSDAEPDYSVPSETEQP